MEPQGKREAKNGNQIHILSQLTLDGRSHLPDSRILLHLTQMLQHAHFPLQKYGSYRCARGPQSSYFQSDFWDPVPTNWPAPNLLGQSCHAESFPSLVALSTRGHFAQKRALAHGNHCHLVMFNISIVARLLLYHHTIVDGKRIGT